MRGEYIYLANGKQFASERFSLTGDTQGRFMLQMRIVGASIGLSMSAEILLAPNGYPLHLAMLCEYAGAKGSATIDFTPQEITAVVRSGNVERRLLSKTTAPCMVMPHSICAYKQLMAVPAGDRVQVPICCIDIFDPQVFLRPRLRQVLVNRCNQKTTQVVPAGTFTGSAHIGLNDSSQLHPLTGEGYFEPTGFPVLWQQPEGNGYYMLASLNA